MIDNQPVRQRPRTRLLHNPVRIIDIIRKLNTPREQLRVLHLLNLSLVQAQQQAGERLTTRRMAIINPINQHRRQVMQQPTLGHAYGISNITILTRPHIHDDLGATDDV